MSWTRRFIWAFWIFVIVMLCWQLYTCNDKLAQDAAKPKQQHFFFYQATKEKVAASEHAGPYVEQTGFNVEDNTPVSGAFTCHVTLTNKGKAKAINVQVSVKPFKGAAAFSDQNGPNSDATLSDQDPNSQISQWVSFPDLDAGQSSTQSVVFTKPNSALNYGNNPKPEIVYQPEKKK